MTHVCFNGSRVGPASGRQQRGQALAEMAILAAVLVPLFLLVPMLGKYTHARQTTQQAARAAAWEATVVNDYKWNELKAQQQRRLLLDRHFGGALSEIQSTPSDAAASAPLGDVMMNTFSNHALIKRNGIDLRPYKNEDAATLMAKLGGVLEKLPGPFPPNQGGLVTAELVVRPENLKTSDGSAARYLAPFDNIGLEIRSRHALLADAWGAAGNGLEGSPSESHERSVANQLVSLAPGSHLDGISDTLEKIEFLEKIPLLGVPLRLRPGYVQPDIVPKERLKPYTP